MRCWCRRRAHTRTRPRRRLFGVLPPKKQLVYKKKGGGGGGGGGSCTRASLRTMGAKSRLLTCACLWLLSDCCRRSLTVFRRCTCKPTCSSTQSQPTGELPFCWRAATRGTRARRPPLSASTRTDQLTPPRRCPAWRRYRMVVENLTIMAYNSTDGLYETVRWSCACVWLVEEGELKSSG